MNTTMTATTYRSHLAFTQYNGTEVTVLRKINDLVDNDGYSHPAFEVRFHDGVKQYAYASELIQGEV